MVKNLPAMQETLVQSLGWEDPLEEGMATNSQYSYLESSLDRATWWATVPWRREWYAITIHEICNVHI